MLWLSIINQCVHSSSNVYSWLILGPQKLIVIYAEEGHHYMEWVLSFARVPPFAGRLIFKTKALIRGVKEVAGGRWLPELRIYSNLIY